METERGKVQAKAAIEAGEERSGANVRTSLGSLRLTTQDSSLKTAKYKPQFENPSS
jgi:hypothetical protein